MSRTFPNAATPLRLRAGTNTASLAGLAATSSWVPSQDTSRSPARNAPGLAWPARGPRTRANNSRNGATPMRRRARVSADDDGAGPAATPPEWVNSRHTPR